MRNKALTNRLLHALLANVSLLAAAFAQLPGDAHPVKIPSGETISFRFCPPATAAPRGNPREAASPRRALRGFSISETEITQGQFAAICGRRKLAEIRKRLQKLPANDPLRSYPNQDHFPVVCLSPVEAIEVCQQLNQSGSTAPSIETRSFRLPSAVEWQYACRAGDVRGRPHFGFPELPWDQPLQFPPGSTYTRGGSSHFQDLKTVMADTTLIDICSSAWTQLKRNAPFEKTQEDFLTIVEEFSDMASGEEGAHTALMTSVLHRSTDFHQDLPLLEMLQPFRPAWIPQGASGKLKATGTPNDWTIREMHSGVREWTFLIPPAQSVEQAWESLQRETVAGSSGGKAGISITAIGAHTHSQDWKDFLIWHSTSPFTWDSVSADPAAKRDRRWIDSRAGLRLILIRELRPDWLATVRSIALQADVKEAHQTFSRFDVTLRDLLKESDKKPSLKKLNFYRSVAASRDPQTGSGETLGRAAEDLGSTDPFFRLLNAAIAAENSGQPQ